jgi:predicted house-cleaning noncanonical NTP pyrophosphatase (MazG superfamily)
MGVRIPLGALNRSLGSIHGYKKANLMSPVTVNYGKLVRDEIPTIILANGDTPVTRILGDDEYIDALYAKIHEETNELAAAPEAEKLSELADALEVLLATAVALGFNQDDVENAMLDKRAKRGGFTKKIWLERTENK